jgi:hypothetical protein
LAFLSVSHFYLVVAIPNSTLSVWLAGAALTIANTDDTSLTSFFRFPPEIGNQIYGRYSDAIQIFYMDSISRAYISSVNDKGGVTVWISDGHLKTMRSAAITRYRDLRSSLPLEVAARMEEVLED